MMDLQNEYFAAQGAEGPDGGPGPKAPLSPEVKKHWNNLVTMVQKKGMAGNPLLDQRDKSLGLELMGEYNKMTPDSPLTPDMISAIQAELARSRELSQKILHGTEAKVNAGDSSKLATPVSPVDGWPGTKTLSTYFPTATTTDPKGKITKDWGFDLEGYYNSLVPKKL